MAVTIISILTVTSIVMLSIRLYDFVHIDDREVALRSGLESDLSLFAIRHENESGEITVEGADGQQIVAPGTSVEYTLRFRNKDTTAIDYQLSAETEFLLGYELPIEIRLLNSDEDYIIGSPTEWIPIKALDGVYINETILAGNTAEYVFQWKWEFEGDDTYDTLLGSLAAEKPMGVEVSMTVHAEANTDIGINGGFMKSGLGEIVFTSIVIIAMGGSFALLVTPPIRKKIAAKKAAKSAAADKAE